MCIRLPFENPQSRLTQEEYNSLHAKLLDRSEVDVLFETNKEELIRTAIRDWPDRIKDLSTAASIKDAKNVRKYLQVLQAAYGELPKGQRESFLQKDERVEASFKTFQAGPNNK